MAALLKNQILKHLSKFTKNLSADKINLSTLKGEGELSNLELNEDILTQLLELPTWLRITKAVCNRVAVKIQWTKLKSQPICLYLDEVIVETETCEQPRSPNSQNQQAPGGKYGFVDRVMDGIYIHVNSVVVKLMSHKFHASLQLSRVKVQSMSPTWQTPGELRSTRIRDPGRGEVLLFKEIEWQTTRIEATAVGMEEDFLTPLRLIANQAKIRICVKKRLSDCAIISSRLTLLLDDLLWVLTITQLKAAILYANSLKEVIERSAQQSKKLAAEKLKKQGHMPESIQNQQQQQQRSAPERQESATAKYFSRFDVLSTSYHLITSRFDLHLCDDSSPGTAAAEEKRHWKISGGSMQITFNKLSIDFYPFHPAGGERKSWYRYMDNIGSRNPWVNKLFAEFRDEAVKLRKICESSQMPSSSSAPSLLAPQTSPSSSSAIGRKTLSPSTSQSVNTSPVHSLNQPARNVSGSKSAQASPVHQAQQQQQQQQQPPKSTRLLESCFVVKVEDVTVYMVSMPGKKRTGPNKLLCSDKRQLHLPPDMSVLHVELTDYFFPEGLDYPVPHSNLYVLVNPIRVTLDFLTLLWSNVFLLTLSNSMDMDFGDRGPTEHVDIKVELLMPRIILPAEEKIEGQPDRPDAVQLQISKLVVTNRRMEDRMSRDDLKATLDQYKRARLFTGADFPNDEPKERGEVIPGLMQDHALNKDNPYIDKVVKTLLEQSTNGTVLTSPSSSPQEPHPTHHLICNSLKRHAGSDIWSASAEQVWLDFLGVQNNKSRPSPFVEAVPVTAWLSVTPRLSQCQKSYSNGSCPASGNAQKSAQSVGRGAGEDIEGYSKQGHPQESDITPGFDSSRLSYNGFDDHICTFTNSPVNGKDSRISNTNAKNHHIEGTDQRHHDSDGNSFSCSHHPYKSYVDEIQPTRISGGGHTNDGSRGNKTQLPQDEHLDCDPSDEMSNRAFSSPPRKPQGRRDSRHRADGLSEVHRSRRSSAEYESRSFSDFYSSKSGVETGYDQARQRREAQYQREDSRSSSSPPLLQTESSGHRREEVREKNSKDRRQRYSGSSGSDRRDVVEGGGGGRKNREYDARYNAEGRVCSDSSRGGSERQSWKDAKRNENCYTPEVVKPQVMDRRVREEEVYQKDVQGQGYRRSRHSSSSSSDVGNVVSRERRLQRSGSRDSRGSPYDRHQEEGEKYSNRGGPYDRHQEEGEKHSNRGGPYDRHHEEGEKYPSRGGPYDRHQEEGEKYLNRGGPYERQQEEGEKYPSRGGYRDEEETERRSVRDSPGRRSVRDGNREPVVDRYEQADRHSCERSSVRSKKRDQMDGILLDHRSHSHDPTRNEGRDERKKDRQAGRQHRSSSRGGNSEHQSYGHERSDQADNCGSRYHPGDSVYRSRLEESSRSRHADADCDNDRYSHTSLSSLDTPARESCRGTEQRLAGPEASKQNDEDPLHWPEDCRDQAWAQNNKRLPPEGCKSQEDSSPNLGKDGKDMDRKICVLARVCEKLRIQLNHFQYLFLLRLSESFSAFQSDLSADLLSMSSIGSTSKKKRPPKPPPSPAIMVPLVLKELEFAVVCPYQMHQRTFSDDFSVVSPFLQGMSSGQDAVFGDEGDGTCFPQLVDTIRAQRFKDDSTLKPFKSNSSSQLQNVSHLGQSPDAGRHAGGLGSNLPHNQSVPLIVGPTPFASSISSKKDGDIMSQSLQSLGKDSGIGIDRKPVSQKQHHSRGGGSGGKGGGSKGSTDMKKALTSAFSSWTDKLKNKMESLDDAHDDDSMSIRTDTSDDDFEHLSLDDAEEVPAFFHDPPPPEVASAGDNFSEVGDPGDSVSMYAESSTTKGKEMVYVVLFKLDHTELMLDNSNDQTTVQVMLAKLVSIQLGNIAYEDFQARFQTPKGYLQEEVSDLPPLRYPICLKYEIPAPNPSLGLSLDPGHVVIRASDFSLQFKMSGITCLSDFAEDEKIPESLPVSVEVTNLLLVLEEDRPSVNITSPGSLPLNVHIQQISIERGRNGIFYISGNPGSIPIIPPVTPTPAPPKPDRINAVTSPIMSPDGTMALLMASQNEAVLLRRQLEEVRRANRLYEHQILQWRDLQDTAMGHRSGMGANTNRGGLTRKRPSISAGDSLSSSPSFGHHESPGYQARQARDDVDPARDELERENLHLQQRIARLEDDLLTVSKEKESLLQTLQLLQDELLASERKQRTKAK